MPTVVQEFTGNSASVERAYARMLEHQKRIEKSLETIVSRTKEAETEQDKWAAKASRLSAAILTPQEKHAAKLKEINELYSRQLITQEQQGRALKQNDEWLKSQVANQKQGYNYGAQYARLLGYQVASYLSINAALQIGNAILKEREELQKRAKDTTVSIADAQRDMFLNLGTKTSPAERDRINASVAGLATKYSPAGGVPGVFSDMANALSAAQGEPNKALGAVEASLQFAPHNAEDRRFIAGAVIDLMSATGSEKPMENLGLLAAMGETTRIPTWRRIAKNLSTGVVGVKKYGGSAQDAAALVTALTSASKDPMGEESATAAISMSYQLSRMVPEKDFYETELDPRTNRYRRRLVAKGTGMADTWSRIAYLQRNPKEMERVLNSLSVEKKQMAAVKDIIEGTGVGQAALDVARGATNRPLGELGADVQKFMGVIGGDFNQTAAQMERRGGSTMTDLQTSLAGKERALEGLFARSSGDPNKPGMQELLVESGENWGNARVASWMEWYMSAAAGRSNEEQFTRTIRSRISALRHGGYWGGLGTPDDANLQQANILEQYLEKQLAEAARLRTEIIGLRADMARQQNKPSPTAVQNNRFQHGEKE